VVVPVLCASIVSWNRRVGAEDLLFFRDGRSLGPELQAAVPPFLDPHPPTAAGLHQYLAVASPGGQLRAVFDAEWPQVPPVEAVSAEESGGVLALRWSQPAPYDAVRVDLDGEPLRLLTGLPPSFVLPSAQARGRLLSLTGIRCRVESEPRFRPLALETPIAAVACELVGAQVEIAIEGPGPYGSLTILRGGKPIAFLDGVERQFIDRDLPLLPGQEVEYCVQGTYESGRDAGKNWCSIRLPAELLPVCEVEWLEEQPVVYVAALGQDVQYFQRVVVVREDLITFEVRGPSYRVRDDKPPEYLADRGVSYFLTSEYQGFLYPTGRCVAHLPPRVAGYIRGDCNGDLQVDVGDPLAVLWRLFGGQPLDCGSACDVDGSNVGGQGMPTITDAIHLLDYLFLSGPPPRQPFPACGLESEVDQTDCRRRCP